MGKDKRKKWREEAGEKNETLKENIMEICSILSNVKCNKAMFPVGEQKKIVFHQWLMEATIRQKHYIKKARKDIEK